MSAISPSGKSALAFWQSLGQKSFAYWLIFPALLVILGLNLYPTIQGILTSFTNQSLIEPGHSLYVGLDNYFKLLKEPVFRVALAHSLELTFSAVVLQVLLGLVMAHLLIQKVPGHPLFSQRRDDHLGAADHRLGRHVPVHDVAELRFG